MNPKSLKLSLVTIAAVLGAPTLAYAGTPALYVRVDDTDFNTATNPAFASVQSALKTVNADLPGLNLTAQGSFEPVTVIEANPGGSLIEAQATAAAGFGIAGLGVSFNASASVFGEASFTNANAEAATPYSGQISVTYPVVMGGAIVEQSYPIVPYTQAANPLQWGNDINGMTPTSYTIPGPNFSGSVGSGFASISASTSWSGSVTPSYDVMIGGNGAGHAHIDLNAQASLTLTLGLSVAHGSVTLDLLGDGSQARAWAELDAGTADANGDPAYCADTAVGYQTQNVFGLQSTIPLIVPSFGGFNPGATLPAIVPTSASCMDMMNGLVITPALFNTTVSGATGQAPGTGSTSGGGGGGGGPINYNPHKHALE